MRGVRNESGNESGDGTNERRLAPRVGRLAVLTLLAGLQIAGTAVAQTQENTSNTAGPQSSEGPRVDADRVDLDRLLRLPDSYDASAAPDSKRGGASETEWRARFHQAYSDISEAEAALDRSQAELEHTASETGNYQVSAPGVSNPQNSPLSFGLQQRMREQRAEIDNQRRLLKKLEIDADLAGVPRDWRKPPPATK